MKLPEIFKSKTRKEREAKEHKARIDLNREYAKFKKDLEERCSTETERFNKWIIENNTKFNGECSKCGSHNIINKFDDGKPDMIQINKCKDCGHEWERKCSNSRSFDVYDKIDNLRFILKQFKTSLSYNPKNPNETFYSSSEKNKDFIDRFRKTDSMQSAKDFWTGTNIDMFKLLIEDYELNGYSYEIESVKQLKKFYDEEILINEIGFVK